MSTFPGAFVSVAPPADGLRLAFVAARRRRNRKAGAVGTAGLLAAVAMLASTGGAGDRPLLEQQPLPPSSTNGLGVVTGAGDPSTAATPPAAPAAGSAVDGVSVRRQAGVLVDASRALPAGGEQATTSADPHARSQRTAPVSGPMSRGSNILYTGSDLTCPARKQADGQRGLCTDLFAGPTSSTGSMAITAEICNVSATTQLLTYPTARELDVSVRRSGVEVWRWSLGRHFADAPHELTIGAQECLDWTTSWAQVDGHGRRVRAGNYDIVADFDADQVSGPERHPSYQVTIS